MHDSRTGKPMYIVCLNYIIRYGVREGGRRITVTSNKEKGHKFVYVMTL